MGNGDNDEVQSDLIRNLFSLAVVVLLTAALAFGNCMSCPDLIPVQKPTHDCCDTEQSPTPVSKECAGKTADFEKMVQPEAAKSLVAAELVTPALTSTAQPHVIAGIVPATTVQSSLLSPPLRI